MASLPRRRDHSKRYTSAEFKPYVTALGQLALAWNDLQESLAGLFLTLVNPPPKEGDIVIYTPLWVWASIKSDRSQREMLKAAINHSKTDWNRGRMARDLNWLIDNANSLEDSRNDAIHSPLLAVDKSLAGTRPKAERIKPATRLFNPRATKLSKRANLLDEFRYCRNVAVTLAEFALLIDTALVNPRRAWPDRPSLPTRAPKRARPNQHRQALPK